MPPQVVLQLVHNIFARTSTHSSLANRLPLHYANHQASLSQIIQGRLPDHLNNASDAPTPVYIQSGCLVHGFYSHEMPCITRAPQVSYERRTSRHAFPYRHARDAQGQPQGCLRASRVDFFLQAPPGVRPKATTLARTLANHVRVGLPFFSWCDVVLGRLSPPIHPNQIGSPPRP